MIQKKFSIYSVLILIVFYFLCIAEYNLSFAQNSNSKLSMENTLYLKLKNGLVVIEMLPKLAPNHVERIKQLVKTKFYDNTPIHRVIEGFMAQMGDPTGTGGGGSDLPDLNEEFSSEPHVRGIVSMARTPDPDSANSQFFIMFDSAPSLDGQYTVWGRVIEGMEFVDLIKKGSGRDGIVKNPDKIITLRLGTKK